MEETPATQYIFAPAEPLYHLAGSERFTLCGLYVSNAPDKRRRRGDLRTANEEPSDHFVMLCLACERTINGEPAPKVNWEASYPLRFAEPIWP
jgi:hypothetical protein